MAGESSAARTPFVMVRFRSILLALFTVAVVVLGLVGMHAMSARADSPANGSSPRQGQSLAQAQPGNASQMTMGANGPTLLSEGATIPVAAGVASAQGCTRICAASCFPVGMVCILGVTVAMIGMLLSSLPSPPVSALRELMRVIRIGSAKLVPASRPSLEVLSISRT
jgi:hypothetical protein